MKQLLILSCLIILASVSSAEEIEAILSREQTPEILAKGKSW